ncbi:MAG: type II toxin-antitoxin system VapC family toxin [Vicinamibacteria bacterium]|nr:type II toxin-antitoxin system VapC family toxin [Vicinamibacteria bacterium]
MIVLDASCALKLILRQASTDLARRVMAAEVHAPCLLDTEVASALRRLFRQRELDIERATAGLDWLFDLGIERHHGEELARRALALRNSLSTCDATYVAVAELLDAPLLTADAWLANSHGHHARIELI